MLIIRFIYASLHKPITFRFFFPATSFQSRKKLGCFITKVVVNENSCAELEWVTCVYSFVLALFIYLFIYLFLSCGGFFSFLFQSFW